MRRAEVQRKTTETNIKVTLDIDGDGKPDIKTGMFITAKSVSRLSWNWYPLKPLEPCQQTSAISPR